MRANVTHLTDEQVETVIDSFFKNENVHDARYLTNQHNRLTKYLHGATGSEFAIDGRTLVCIVKYHLDDDVPV